MQALFALHVMSCGYVTDGKSCDGVRIPLLTGSV